MQIAPTDKLANTLAVYYVPMLQKAFQEEVEQYIKEGKCSVWTARSYCQAMSKQQT